MHLSSRIYLFATKTLRLGDIIGSTFILALVIDIEIAKTITSFLAVY